MYSEFNLPEAFRITEEIIEGKTFRFLNGPGLKQNDGTTQTYKTLLQLVAWGNISETGGAWYRSRSKNQNEITKILRMEQSLDERSRKYQRIDESGCSRASSSREGEDVDLEIEQFISKVEEAVDRRMLGPSYKYIYLFAVHWVDSGDDHLTSDDCEVFCDTIDDAFTIRYFIHAIEKGCGVDVWTHLNSAYIKDMSKEARNQPEDVLIIFYYSGEAIIGNKRLELFGIDPDQEGDDIVEGAYTLRFELLRESILSRGTQTLFIMDCCCAGLASRGGALVAEYLCAANEDQSFSDGRRRGLFTSTLVECINKFVYPFSVEDLYNSVKESHDTAYYKRNSGSGSIVLKPRVSDSDNDVRRPPPESGVRFGVEVALPREMFVEAKKANFKLEARYIFHKNSTHFIFHTCIVGLNILKSLFEVEIVRINEIHVPNESFVVLYEHDKVINLVTTDEDFEPYMEKDEGAVAELREPVQKKRIMSTSSEVQFEEDRKLE